MSVIYVYRPWTYANGAASPPIQLDDIGEDELVNGSYLRFEAKPGQHKIAIPAKFDFMMVRNWPNVAINLSTEANKEYYVRYSTAAEIRPGGLYSTVIQFNLAFQIVPKELALKELQK
jgi:hypothetical protein